MSQRQKLIDLITENVRIIAARGSQIAFERLEEIESFTGFLTDRSPQSCESLANYIIAFAAMASRNDLINTAHGAVFFRIYNGKQHRSSAVWDHANTMADDALRACGVDVDARNERDARDEARMMAQASRRLARRAAREARAA